MPIPENQLETWTHQGSVTGSSRTYSAVKAAIDAWSPLGGRGIDVFLQGSYKNSTNIRGDSDVDVVVHCPQTFFYDPSRLTQVDKNALALLPDATYRWDEFRGDVYAALISWFGSAQVKDGNKCIKVWEASNSHISGDVVPAFTHWLYVTRSTGHEGIAFVTQNDRRRIVNFPKQHYDNAVAKQQSTFGSFKPTVRMFKNATVRLVELGWLTDKDACSYFVECCLWNVPDSRFIANTWQALFCQVYDYLGSSDWSGFMCLNGIVPLLGTGPDEWLAVNAQKWLAQLRNLWMYWPK
jgi:hypothetical protein